MQTEPQNQKQDKKVERSKNFLRKQRRKNKIIKTLQKTAKNRIFKNQYKKAKRDFNKCTKENLTNLFQNCFSKISILKQKGIINIRKMSRLHSKLNAKLNSLNT